MKKIAYLAILVVGLLVGAAIAAVMWEGSITWIMETREFSVWDSAGTPMPSYSEDLGPVPPGDEIFDFYLQNDGSVEITIQATETACTGATALWNQDSWTIQPQTRALAQLTLTITSAGTYTWTFTIAP